LANYLGPASVDSVDRLAPGETTDVAPFGNGVAFIYLDRKVGNDIPPLASIRELVLADALRDRQERALENLLSSLRQSARIEYSDAPSALTSAPPAAPPPVAASR
jgi:hypothetical protein